MGRRKRVNRPKDKTTWAVSIELSEKVLQFKKRAETIDDFIYRIFSQWQEWKDSISFYEEAFQKQSIMIEKLNADLDQLKQPSLIHS